MKHHSIEQLSEALDAAPLDVALHRRMLEATQAEGDEAGYAAHQIALAAFDMLGPAAAPHDLALALYNLATVYSLKGRAQQAIRWYRHTLAVQPLLAIAHQNLAVLLATEGDSERAEWHRDQAYRLQRVYVEPALGTEQRRLLILNTGKGTGNIPLDTLLSYTTTSRIKYAIDYAREVEDAQLPAYDLVLNAIGDPDIAEPLAERIAHFTQGCGRPVLNPPEAVARTHRHRTPGLLASVPDTLVPRCIRLDAMPASAEDLERQLTEAGIAYPLLMRPVATHGGEKLELFGSIDALWPALAEVGAPCYLTAYHDFRAADGCFRKYRIIYVDRRPYPYHLAISPHWMVHYFSAGMLDAPWKLDEERRFLADPRTALGSLAVEAIDAIGLRLDLDYGGIDFTVMPDGRVLVFEANATMLVHREKPNGPLAHKNPFIDRIAEAFERMQIRTVS
ncbi:ATP-grasp domain-containing protein [Trinickia dinghuensis]|uniref:ATP-grasp domain-containing protein n=1 Tax=Trinickia dinghuensis TaxID=2291023 RepID=UPI0015F19B4F|nr:hypothetical protein [Trinickia dinghuensis]